MTGPINTADEGNSAANAAPLIFDAAGVKALDRAAELELGLSEAALIARAGAALERVALRMLGEMANRGATGVGTASAGGVCPGVLVLCGPGNNGADGRALAGLLLARGVPTMVVSPQTQPPPPPQSQRGPELEVVLEPELVGDGPVALDIPGGWFGVLIVDCLLGVGLSRAVTGALAGLIAAVNELRTASEGAESGQAGVASVRVLACDIPSGLDASTGEPRALLPTGTGALPNGTLPSRAVLGAIIADVTLTFMGPKLGMLAPGAPRWCGRVEVDMLDLPRALLARFAQPLLAGGGPGLR